MLVFLIDVDVNWKTGLFNAIESRVIYYSPDLVLNISYVDSFFLSLLKRIFGKGINTTKESFSFGKIHVQTVEIKRGLTSHLASKLPFLCKLILQSEANIIKNIIEKENLKKDPINLIAHWGLTSGIYSYFLRGFVSNYFNFYHGSDVHTEPKKNKQILNLTIAAMNSAKLNFFVSNGLVAAAKELGYTKVNNAVSYNGVNTAAFQNYHVHNENPVVGYAGNLFTVKGADLLPEIFFRVKTKFPNVRFRVAGDGHLKLNILNSFYQKDVQVEMLGKLQPIEMPKFYASLDLLVIPSRNEALSIAAIEALAAGCNVVAANVGGLPEVVDSEYLVDWSECFIDSISNRICLVLEKKPNQILKPCFDQLIALESEYAKFIGMK